MIEQLRVQKVEDQYLNMKIFENVKERGVIESVRTFRRPIILGDRS
jgi:hypothetical protein